MIRRSWTFRASRWLEARIPGRFVRTLARVGALRRPPPRPGVTSRLIARPRNAEANLRTMAQSATVFGASTWRLLGLAGYPLRCYRGNGQGGKSEPIDPARTPWVAQLLRLLDRPDPADWSPTAIAPAKPGELLVAQLLLDLSQEGNAFCACTVDAGGVVIGLTRLHPKHITLEGNASGEEEWVYRPGGRYGNERERRYPRRTVFHIRLLSWEATGAGELGTGAAEPLAPLLRAEHVALTKSADIIEQGGADVRVTGKTDKARAFLSNENNREDIADEVIRGLGGGDDSVRTRRVMVDGGEFEIQDAGLKPADIQAEKLLNESRKSTLVAMGVTPIAVGAADAGTYATSVQQFRVQATTDAALLLVLEACFLRPLARHFAFMAGGRWARQSDEVTCRVDLTRHPGRNFQRTDAIARMKTLTEMGWTAEQAAEFEGLDLPAPEGKPRPSAAAPAASGAPRRPLGDADGESGDPDDGEESDADRRVLTIQEFLDRRGVTTRTLPEAIEVQ